MLKTIARFYAHISLQMGNYFAMVVLLRGLINEGNIMFVSGHEDWDAMEIASKLMGDEITPGDIDGLHGAVIVLCKRVAELEGKVDRIRYESGIVVNE